MHARTQVTLLAVGIATALAGCGGPAANETASAPPPAATPSTPSEPTPVVTAVSDADLGRVCRAAVAALNGGNPAIIKVERVEDGIANVGYARPSDGKVWKNRCRIEGDRLIWASVDLNGPGTGPGRWRTEAEDEVVTYAIEGETVKVRIAFSDGSSEPEHAYKIAKISAAQ
jgi:hypothetical protein